MNDTFVMLFNSHVISASSISDGVSTPITSRHFCYNVIERWINRLANSLGEFRVLRAYVCTRHIQRNVTRQLCVPVRLTRQIAFTLRAYPVRDYICVCVFGCVCVLTDAIISPITPMPQPISSIVTFLQGLSISITALATFNAPAAFDQKLVFGESCTFSPPTTSSRASAPTKNVVFVMILLLAHLKRMQ